MHIPRIVEVRVNIARLEVEFRALARGEMISNYDERSLRLTQLRYTDNVLRVTLEKTDRCLGKRFSFGSHITPPSSNLDLGCHHYCEHILVPTKETDPRLEVMKILSRINLTCSI
jgi:hypothetical protein